MEGGGGVYGYRVWVGMRVYRGCLAAFSARGYIAWYLQPAGYK